MKYKLIDRIVPAVEMYFEQAGEEMITQSGGMAWMSDGVNMETNMTGGAFAGIGRMFAGESLFMAHYKAMREGATIAFAATVPGSILPINISDYPSGLICQKGAFLCAQPSVNFEVTLTKKLSSGFFGGEGFVLEKLSGTGMVFLETDGGVIEKVLNPGEVIKIDTGNVVAFEQHMPYEIETVKGFKNILFGGEGLFLTKITGPGKVLLQTQNIKEFAGRIASYIPQKA